MSASGAGLEDASPKRKKGKPYGGLARRRDAANDRTWYRFEMARPEKERPRTLDEAVAELKRDPSHPIRLVVDGIEIELRSASSAGVIPGALDQANLGDRIAAIGPWQGETTDEVIELLRKRRDATHRKLPDLL